MIKTCLYCNNQFKADANIRKFCSQRCQWDSMIKMGNRINGVTDKKSGYKSIWIKERGWILEHRYLMEKKIGRELKSHECVHHKNEIRHDNKIENLQLMDRSSHKRLHRAKLLNRKLNSANDFIHADMLYIESAEDKETNPILYYSKINLSPTEFIKRIIDVNNSEVYSKDENYTVLSFEDYLKIRDRIIWFYLQIMNYFILGS